MNELDCKRVRAAMALIEQAQGLVRDAAAECLSPVPGFAREWESTLKLYDTIKAHWYKIERALLREQNKRKKQAR